MGGRGSSSSVSDKGIAYGTQYRTVLQVGTIKYIEQIAETSVTVPLETMSADKNRKYVVLGQNKQPQSIVLYDESGRKEYQIDLTHGHHAGGVHMHIGYDHSKPFPLTKNFRSLVKRVRRKWAIYQKTN